MTEKLAPCLGRWSLFDSVTLESHRVARDLCASCPVIIECAAELEATRRAAKPGYGPRGTWAGRLVGVAKADERARIRREDAAYDAEAARRAHSAWRRGDRSAWAAVGHNVYERRRASRRRKVDAA